MADRIISEFKFKHLTIRFESNIGFMDSSIEIITERPFKIVLADRNSDSLFPLCVEKSIKITPSVIDCYLLRSKKPSDYKSLVLSPIMIDNAYRIAADIEVVFSHADDPAVKSFFHSLEAAFEVSHDNSDVDPDLVRFIEENYLVD